MFSIRILITGCFLIKGNIGSYVKHLGFQNFAYLKLYYGEDFVSVCCLMHFLHKKPILPLIKKQPVIRLSSYTVSYY